MGLKLENLDTRLRDRIQRQMRAEDATKAAKARGEVEARNARPCAAVGEKPTTPLVAATQAEEAGAGGGGERYRVDWVIYSCQPLDWDNSAASIKEHQDFLVALGWLPGDDYKRLEGSAISVKVATRKEQRTEVVITRIR